MQLGRRCHLLGTIAFANLECEVGKRGKRRDRCEDFAQAAQVRKSHVFEPRPLLVSQYQISLLAERQ